MLKTTPYWWEAAPREASEPTEVPSKADVVVVGSGYAGLSAALTLARAGRSVVVLEAGTPGQGASTRSGGMVGHGHRRAYTALVSRFGREHAIALVKEGIASLDFAADLIEREGIDAKFARFGRFRGAATPGDYETMGREADALTRDIGLPVHLIPRAEQAREVVTDVYHGGLLFPTHGGLHPALFQTGLLSVARKAGAQVIGFTPVTGVMREGDGFTVTHERGSIQAREVVACTNGYTRAGFPDLARRLVGTPSFLIATEELGENRVRSLIPNQRMIVETRTTHLYFRPSPDGKRIILGGRAALHPIPMELVARRLKGYLAEVLPDLGSVEISHAWTGNVAMTRGDLPGIGQRDGVHYAVGCNGSGVALMPYLGHKVACKVLGLAEGVTAYDRHEPPAIPFYDGRPWFLPAMTAWWRYKDWRSGRGRA